MFARLWRPAQSYALTATTVNALAVPGVNAYASHAAFSDGHANPRRGRCAQQRRSALVRCSRRSCGASTPSAPHNRATEWATACRRWFVSQRNRPRVIRAPRNVCPGPNPPEERREERAVFANREDRERLHVGRGMQAGGCHVVRRAARDRQWRRLHGIEFREGGAAAPQGEQCALQGRRREGNAASQFHAGMA